VQYTEKSSLFSELLNVDRKFIRLQSQSIKLHVELHSHKLNTAPRALATQCIIYGGGGSRRRRLHNNRHWWGRCSVYRDPMHTRLQNLNQVTHCHTAL